ncbi:ChrR family anti-sigma-E factor [Alphaproteobacteria bacterium]|nr:ChrR family anti-sigma-E factor [Alphaproteobacteria bacterium]
MIPTHHPDFEILLDYASGNLPLAPSVIIAVHVSMCPECREILKSIEIAGAVLTDNLNNENIETSSLEKVLSKLDYMSDTINEDNVIKSKDFDLPIPSTLKPYMPNDLNWKNLSSGVKTLELLTNDGFNLDIYKILPGYKIPKHTHKGSEFTLVFDGGYTDEDNHFGPGDFSLLDHTTDHAPRADSDKDCYCIVAMNSKIKLTGTFSRFINFINN